MEQNAHVLPGRCQISLYCTSMPWCLVSEGLRCTDLYRTRVIYRQQQKERIVQGYWGTHSSSHIHGSARLQGYPFLLPHTWKCKVTGVPIPPPTHMEVQGYRGTHSSSHTHGSARLEGYPFLLPHTWKCKVTGVPIPPPTHMEVQGYWGTHSSSHIHGRSRVPFH